MFQKVLIANRGEIAVRILRACRDMGIQTVAVYHASDISSLHVRLADECFPLESNLGYLDQKAILRIARDTGADAIHPGYGFFAERADFARACEREGIVFIGPPADVIDALTDKPAAMAHVRAAGFPTPEYAFIEAGGSDINVVRAEADRLGYPVLIKSSLGGRGRGAKLVRSPDRLEATLQQAQAEAHTIYRRRQVYLEKAIFPARQVAVQIVADSLGDLIHLGERTTSLQRGNQKLIEESPTPGLAPDQRKRLWQTALDIARSFNYRNVGSVEFLVNDKGQFSFTEMKARIQMEHTVTEMVSQVDLVQEQIRIAAGETLTLKQEEVRLRGCAIQCRINAEDPWQNFMPSPGQLSMVRLPGGFGVRVDTYVYGGASVPARYDPLVAKLIVWGETREECMRRVRRALEDFALTGVATNLPLLQSVLNSPILTRSTSTIGIRSLGAPATPAPEPYLRDLAAAVAVAYAQRSLAFRASLPERLQSGWHRASRELPH